MLIHGQFKIMSNLEYILKYINNTFPEIHKELFSDIKGSNYEKLITWHRNVLQPRCQTLTELMLNPNSLKVDKTKEVQRFEKLLKNMDDMLRDGKSTFLSGTESVSAIDVTLHSEVSTVIFMYSTREKLNKLDYPYLQPWMDRMQGIQVIYESL